MGVCPGKSNWKCNRILLRDTLPFCILEPEKGSNRKKIISPYFSQNPPCFRQEKCGRIKLPKNVSLKQEFCKNDEKRVLFILCFGRIKSGGNEKMKFTEGYWLPSEKANASHAMQAYEVEQIPGGMRILATTRPIEHRGMTLNLPTITVEFVAHTPDTISMEAWHYEAYDNKVPSFDKTESVYEDVTVTINEDEAVLDTGSVQVRVQRKGVFAYTFEADGKVLTGSGFRNLSYIRWDRQQSTMLPAQNYMTENISHIW